MPLLSSSPYFLPSSTKLFSPSLLLSCGSSKSTKNGISLYNSTSEVCFESIDTFCTGEVILDPKSGIYITNFVVYKDEVETVDGVTSWHSTTYV